MKVIEFLKNAKVYYAATEDGGQPHVRPIGFVMEYNGGLAFYSDKRKNMYKQLMKNPKMEICALDEKFNTLRIKCEAEFITSEDSQKAAFADSLKSIRSKILKSLSPVWSVKNWMELNYSLSRNEALR